MIVGLACVVFGIFGSYLYKAGGYDLIVNAVASPNQAPGTPPPTIDEMAGVYSCDEHNGCTEKYVLLLKSDQSAEMTLVKNSEEEGSSGVEEQAGVQQPLPLVTNELSQATDTAVEIANNPLKEIATSTQTKEKEQAPTDPSLQNITTLENLDHVEPITIEKGTWDITVQNMIVINFTEQGTTTYAIPRKLVVKSTTGKRLSKINYTKSIYKEMKDPVFVKID
jgi:hypothetical protein